MLIQTYIGLDPGASGGIAWVNALGNAYNAVKMPETDADICELLERLTIDGTRSTHATIEKVNPGVFGRPGAKMGVVSAFTFGGGYRALKMALTCLRIPFDEALPVKWQTALSCRTKGDKNISKARAQQLFPHMKITHATADALLIAEYGRRLHSGAAPATAAQQELYGEEDKAHEARPDEAHEGRHAGPRSQEGDGADEAAAEVAARHGRSRHRRDRESSARIRRRA